MPFPNITFREFLDGATRQELEQFSALLQGYLQREHASNGSHKDITGYSLTVTEDADTGATGAVTAETLTVSGRVTHDGLFDQDAVFDSPVSVSSLGGNWTTTTLGTEMNVRVTSASAKGGYLDGAIDPTTAGAGVIGTVYRVYNDSGVTFALKHESSSATAASYRFLCPGAADAHVRPHGAFWLVRDETENRWRVIGDRGPIVIRPAQLTGNQNNYAPTGWYPADVVLLDLDAARTITGFDNTFDGDGKRILNISGFDLTISHNSASSSAINRVIAPGGADYTLTSGGGLWLTYDNTAAFWRITDK